MNMQQRISKAASLGFSMLTDGVNFDIAIKTACARYCIEQFGQAFESVRYRMARDLYEW